MKHIFFLLLFFSLSTSAFSQQYQYCELIVAPNVSAKVIVQIDSGQARSSSGAAYMKNPQSEKRITFNSVVEALNIMGAEGWECMGAYSEKSFGVNYNHYLLKRRRDALGQK